MCSLIILSGDSLFLYKEKGGYSVSPSHSWVCRLSSYLKAHWLFSGLNCPSTCTLHVQILLHHLCYHSLLIFSFIIGFLCKLALNCTFYIDCWWQPTTLQGGYTMFFISNTITCSVLSAKINWLWVHSWSERKQNPCTLE